MTVDFSATPDNSPTSKESDSPMFAPTPAWERGRKRRGFGGGRTSRVAEEPRSFASEPETTTAAAEQGAYAPDPMAPARSAQPTESMFAGTPAYAGATLSRKHSSAPVAIAAGVILLGGLGAAGWYYTQSRDSGIAQLTPGSTATTTTSAAPAAPTTPTTGAASDQLAQTGAPPNTPPAAAPSASPGATAAPPVTTHSTTTTTTTTRSSAPAATHRTVTARARTASGSAQDVSSDATATAPATAAPAPQVAPLVNVPPPAPATSPAPAPTQTPPQ